MSNKKIAVLGTGGTIAGLAKPGDALDYKAAEQGIDQLLADAALPALAGIDVLSEQVAQIDSKDMALALWQQLAGRTAWWLAQPDVLGVVITHGTDTLEETAFFLSCVLPGAKPVVLTCAMRPANARLADGPQNLADALAMVATPGAQGVSVVCAGVLHSARDVQKVHSWKLDAFSSGDAGPLGHIVGGALFLTRNWPGAGGSIQKIAIENIVALKSWPRVEIVLSHAGASGALVHALVQGGVRGIVVAGTGNGTLHHDLEAALLQAQAAGVRVLRSSRCVHGGVQVKTSDQLPAAEDLSPVKARIALLLDLVANRA